MPLRVTVELIPHGDESRKSVIGQMDIENTGRHPHRPEFGEYRFTLAGQVWGGDTEEWHRDAALSSFRRSRGYWACVRECLNAVDVDYEPEDPEA
ncbi:MAG: hypothetical protein AAF636_11475 [Pseudomonadota bacterium]